MNNPSKIIGIQFSILSPDEIRKGSVAEITSRDTYINNKPVIGGLFDPRMGVLEPGLICPTDGLDYMQTPGYFGHIELARPVFYIQYLSTIQKLLRCVCFKCSKLLISKEKYKQALKITGDARWKYVFSLASKMKRCGEDTEDGCGCLQPNKIRKEGLATIFAEWKNESEDGENIVIKLVPEMVLKIFKRISDEDVSFMGFSPIWSRPDWMVCQVMAVPPPAVRPSVKHDAQQRSEDDLSHILVNIIKTNKTLQEKIQNNSPANVIDDWTTVLQYYVATQVDNKIPGVASVAQRSGRPLKSIKDRLNGKGGRMRGNLMAKRVDFSARSVITADPNISIRDLGIPMKIAKNITKPVVVNKINKAFLTKLVLNGPDEWPGAKILEKKNGESITLRYVDRKSIILEEGDIVHRHMMDGDPILFNRQPTLHRMSMMCHIAKIMKIGDTFRMNVADTKPYNADFDGDEMNLHMPQDVESESELKNLAAVPYQLISPANNKPIIGIYQDSMLGCYRFTRENINFTPREAMNLLMMFQRVNEEELLSKGEQISSFDLLSQIMNPLSLSYKTKAYKDDENPKTSNHILEIRNGKYLRGQIDKDVLGAGTKGLIQRSCNDFGNMAASNFIDDLQNIITEYMKSSSFSVGISDLISDDKTNQEIINVIEKKKQDVKNLIDQTQIGVFENNTGKTNEQEFETQVNNILNQASSEAGKIGLKSLDKNNRFVIMVNAGSKGSDLNISQMISCLGQQNVDGKRIPYGFEQRTLPHYTKFDDSPGARGFVESSYINGLSPQELFFHAMGGRVGLIDTAVKTSTTGYIQRRIIKGLEDLMVNYDMTIRTNKSKIVQFAYGEDGIDTVRVENQQIPIVSMSIQDIYAHFNMPDETGKFKGLNIMLLKNTLTRFKKQVQDTNDKCKKYTDFMIQKREEIIKNVFKNKGDSIVNCPVAFSYIINNIQGQQNINANSLVDITPLEAFGMIEETYENLEKIHYAPPTQLFKVLYYYYLSPKDLLFVKRFNKTALSVLLNTIQLTYKRAIVTPGEMVGMLAAQSIGEVSTQMTLNTFHFAGVAAKSNVTRGVPRIEEILSLSSEPKNPSLTVYLKKEEETDKDKAHAIMYMLEHTILEEIVESIEICFDPDDLNTMIEEDKSTMDQYRAFESMIDECANVSSSDDTNEKSKWIIRMVMDQTMMLEKNLTMDDVNFTLNNSYGDEISCVFSDYNSDKLVFRIRMNNIMKQNSSRSGQKKKVNPLDQSDQIYILKNFQDQLLQNIVLRGIKGINKVIMRKIKDNVVETSGVFKKQDIWVLDTVGTNMMSVLALDYIDANRTISNDIVEVFNVLGIEAARQTIYNELVDVIEFDGTYINSHNFSLLCDRMTFTSKMISIFRHGINNDNIGPIAKASFEETPEMFLKAARHAELDTMRGISANVMCGQEGFYGTSAFQVVLNIDEMKELEEVSQYEGVNEQEDIEKMFGGIENSNDTCSTSKLAIQNNVVSISASNLGSDNNYNPGF
uniref:DNA-directed RNA polymerase n=1 Tax=viral metagenome TaxID=1070528 RepID=A0A6C0DUD9_9ZZZZ